MKLKLLLSSLLVYSFSFCAFSQTVYYLKYNFQNTDAIIFHTLFLQYDDGTALARIRFENPLNKEDVVVEMNMEQQAIQNSSGIFDSTRFIYKSTAQRFITDDNKVKFDPDIVFLFKNNSLTGFSEPAGAIASYTAMADINPQTAFTAELKEKSKLDEKFIRAFSVDGEDFTESFFQSGTKGLTPEEKNTKMYLLVVANVLDKDIGLSCAKDTGRMLESFRDIARKLGIPDRNTFIKVIAGDTYSKKNVQAAIANFIKPGKNDIVIFYYSGHGFRKETDRKVSQFPFIDLRTKADSNYMAQSLNMEKDIFKPIVNKGARFNLVMGDCCNTYAPLPKAKGSKPGKSKGSGFLLSQENCYSLFMNSMPISILACAADSNQLATGTAEFGGFFSYFLKTSMENYCSIFKKNVTWNQVLADTYKQTIYKADHTYCDKPYIPANICSQRPIFKTIPATLP